MRQRRPEHHVGDTAVVLSGLDLVISTETAVPNLSAALGIPTCILSTPDPDWRWTCWYAGVSICRQEVAGNWFGAIAGALEVIRSTLSGRHPLRASSDA